MYILKECKHNRRRSLPFGTVGDKMGFISKGYSAHRNIRMTEDQIKVIPNLKYNKEYEIND